MAAVEIVFTNKTVETTYEEHSWWLVTSGRNPEVAVDGPFETEEQARQARSEHPDVRRDRRGYYTNV